LWYEPYSSQKELKSRYEGLWQKGERSGLGIFFYCNGTMYKGEWKSNKKNGFGIFINHEGVIKEGIFSNDRIVSTVEDPFYSAD